MDFLKQNIIPIVAGILLLGGVYVYIAYFSNTSSPMLTASNANVALSQDLLVTLQNLHTIKLDNSVFSDPAFKSLSDFGVTIPSEDVGRRNPFVPLTGLGSGSGISIPLPNTNGGSLPIPLPKKIK